MKIDWNEAPEGFPLWLEGTNEDHRKHSGWYRERGLVYEGAHGGQWRSCREGQFFTVHRKPELLEWTGEGLPPVGMHVEWWAPKHSWLGGTVVGHDGTVTIIRHNDGYEGCNSDRIRPIRTPEQIAAEERDKAVEELAAEIAGWSNREESTIGQDLLAMYLHDHGYRKQVKP